MRFATTSNYIWFIDDVMLVFVYLLDDLIQGFVKAVDPGNRWTWTRIECHRCITSESTNQVCQSKERLYQERTSKIFPSLSISKSFITSSVSTSCRIKSVSAWATTDLLLFPDFTVLLSSWFVLILLRKLTRPVL